LETSSVKRMRPVDRRGDVFSKERIISPAESTAGACETAGKSGKQIERCVLSTLQIAERLDCKGDSREWEELLVLAEGDRPTDCKELRLKDPLKSDVCLMASEKRAIVDRGFQ
jgi:hypothetical protein